MTIQNDEQNMSGQTYWRSIETMVETPEFLAKLENEFPQSASELQLNDPVGRRKFLGIMGASMALAGVTGCVRKPDEKIVEYAIRPEEIIPGEPLNFATSALINGSVVGLVVKSMDGRPIKIEGNSLHPGSLGATSIWAQAEVLNIYDTARSRSPREENKETSWEAFYKALGAEVSAAVSTQGTGLALLVDAKSSPTYAALVTEFIAKYPQAKVYSEGLVSAPNRNLAFSNLGLSGHSVSYQLDKADVVLSLDSDFMGTEGDTVRNAGQFAELRRVSSANDKMNRLYAVEPVFTVTGLTADHRIRIASSHIGEIAKALAASMVAAGLKLPAGLDVAKLKSQSAVVMQNEKWINAVAADLVKNPGRTLISVGLKQPAWVQELVMALNVALGNLGTTMHFYAHPESVGLPSLSELAASLKAGQVKTLIMLGGNPVYNAPADLNFESLIKSVKTIHASFYIDETSQVSNWHVPLSHFLESWGDTRSSVGAVSIQQPLIAPLFGTLSEIEILNRVIGNPAAKSYDIVRKQWSKTAGTDFEKSWRKWVHDGIDLAGMPKPATLSLKLDGLTSALNAPQDIAKIDAQNLELNFHLDYSILDGRYANNGWLQELPDPVTKLTWDNAVFVGPSTAKTLGIKNEDVVEIDLGGRKLNVPVWIVPGTADNVLSLPLGYGRNILNAKISTGAGVNANVLRSSAAPYYEVGAKIRKLGTTYRLANTQEHGSMEGRNIVREATIATYKKEPAFVLKSELMPVDKQRTYLWKEPNQTKGHQWGMAIDLNTCIGCNACTIACQAENNIPVVGKDRVLMGREMHWIRIDRYFNGANIDDPQIVVQPLTCMQCENAPCESVCPVAATVHSDDGLNDMVYNRCIGTRYCANNCPYKVRRFNFFNFAKENLESSPMASMQKNPNVTVRFRGVMEKCTYCVQRIREAQIEAKREGNGVVKDGRITTACAQVCPTRAITFGDINDLESTVSKMKAQDRNYGLLGELNTQPRTSYLAKLRNPNPELESV